MSIRYSILFTLCLALAFNGIGQNKKTPVENGVLYKVKYRNRVAGQLLEDNDTLKKVLTLEGDPVYVPSNVIRKEYLPNEIRLYNNKRFQYKSSILWNYSLGFSGRHFNIDFAYGKRFENGLELGIGSGFHANSFSFFTTTSAEFVNIISFPVYAQGKFMLNKGRKRFYAKGRVGIVNNLATWNITSIKDGVMLDGGFGLILPSKRRLRHYFELSQYTSYASGMINSTDENILSDVSFDIWFNRVIFTYGIEIGK